MDINDLGYGGGGGILGAILAWFGFKSRIDRQDKEIIELKKNVMYKDTCDATHKPIDTTLARMEDKLDKLIDREHGSRTTDDS